MKNKCPLCNQEIPEDFDFVERWKEAFKEEGIMDEQIYKAFKSLENDKMKGGSKC